MLGTIEHAGLTVINMDKSINFYLLLNICT